MARIFSPEEGGFLAAYENYANDGFLPPQFNTWIALSIVAGALERKVWLPWDNTFSFYPNIYVLFVGKPGRGKSIALTKGVDLLREVSRKSGHITVLPSHVTKAKFIELVAKGRSFTRHWAEPTDDGRMVAREMITAQNAGYYFASEASNSLCNIFGDFIACLTDFYDCPSHWEDATKKGGLQTLRNVCINVCAASTFDYLGKLVGDENIQGGFASRLLYVVDRSTNVRENKFRSGLSAADNKARDAYREAMINDLADVWGMIGPMDATPEYGAAWEAWWRQHQLEIMDKPEKMQSILARTSTNVIKVSILLSAAESSAKVLELRHFTKAVELVEALNAEIPQIFGEAIAQQGVRKAGAIPHIVISFLRGGPIGREHLVSRLVMAGSSTRDVNATIDAMLAHGHLKPGPTRAGTGQTLMIGSDAETLL